jgi:branched-chain amino acid aminotransferase
MTENIFYVNGAFVPESRAAVSVMDHGLLYGDGVFETVFATHGRIFKLDAHIERCFRSMAAIGLTPNFDREDLRRLVIETAARNRRADAYIKWVVTRGVNGRPLLDPADCVPGLIIMALPYLHRASEEKIARGLRLKTVAVRRPPGEVLDPRIKSLNYLNLVLAKLEARAAGADEALLLDIRGRVCEATGCNLFMLRDGRLLTPQDDVLAGITRETIFELAEELGIAAEERALELYDLYTADECLICSTAGGILPATVVDGRRIGVGTPGPMVARLREAYARLLESVRHGTAIGGARAA